MTSPSEVKRERTRVYVCGHRNPDTDSIASAIGYAELKNQLGAVKVKRRGVLSYALPDQLGDSDWAAARLQRLVAEWVQSVEAAGNLIILRTPPGSAHLVALAIDQARLPEVAGTIAGDDTLFLALRDGAASAAVAARFRSLSQDPA